MPTQFRQRLFTILYAALNAAFFLTLGLRLPLLHGPVAGSFVAALPGVQLFEMGAIGIFFAPPLASHLTLALAPIRSTTNHARSDATIRTELCPCDWRAGDPLAHRVLGFDYPTAFWGAVLGGLTDMRVFGKQAVGHDRTLSIIHATRVLAMVTFVPFGRFCLHGSRPHTPARRDDNDRAASLSQSP